MRFRKLPDRQANELTIWLLSEREVPEGDGFKQFGGFALWGKGA
jgi:hypothetical protein